MFTKIVCIFLAIAICQAVDGKGTCWKLENKTLNNLLNVLVEMKTGSNVRNNLERKLSPAFSATLQKTVTLSGVNAVLKFERIILNRGNSYDPKTGFFTAPRRGLYQFTATVMSHSGGELNVAITKNRKFSFYLYGTKFNGATESATGIFELNKGDTVSVMHTSSGSQNVYGYSYSHFSGHFMSE